ncbi:MAG: HEAT repeat domain-containing protein [Spirochaetota bacterium]
MSIFKPNIEKLKKKNDIAGLTKSLNHRSADVRYAAFSALAGISDLNDDVTAMLKNMLNDKSQKVRIIATLKFAVSSAETNANNLLEIINNGSQQEKIDLMRIIAGRNGNADEGIIQAIALAMIDKNELVKLEAIETAGATGNPHFVPNLKECMRDKLHWVRIQSVKALYRIEGVGSVNYLIGLLADRDPEAQRMARSYLATLDSDYARKVLHDSSFQLLIKGMNDIEAVRRDTADKIGREKIKEGLPLLYTALHDEYKEVRNAAIKAIGVFKDPSSIDYIARMLDDKYQDTRIEAVKAISQIISKDSLKPLEYALKKGDHNVRDVAQKAIYSLKANIEYLEKIESKDMEVN